MHASPTLSAIEQPACKLARIAAASVFQLFIGSKHDLMFTAYKFLIGESSKAQRPNTSNTLR